MLASDEHPMFPAGSDWARALDLISLGLQERAVEDLTVALGEARKGSDPFRVVQLLQLQSVALRRSYDFDAALVSIQEARRIASGLPSAGGDFILTSTEAQIHLESGNPERAIPLLEPIVRALDESHAPLEWAGMTTNLGIAHAYAGHGVDAIRCFMAASRGLRDHYTPERYGLLCINMASALKDLNRTVEGAGRTLAPAMSRDFRAR